MRKNNKQDMTIVEQLIRVQEEICDKYCKYPSLESPNDDGVCKACETCPLGRIGV